MDATRRPEWDIATVFIPGLTPEEREVADIEGWILGVV
jgi:hypothetical protein